MVSPAEQLPFQDETFDVVYLPDVLHHLDVAKAVREVKRVLKPDGLVLGNEPYTHSRIQELRQSSILRMLLYPKMVKYIYGVAKPYITADERKLNQHDFDQLAKEFCIVEKMYFLLFVGRLLPIASVWAAKIDKIVLMVPFVGHFLAGRVVFSAIPRRRIV